MPSCAMRYCTNYSNKTCKTQGITYHSFPNDELRCIEWVDIVRKQRSEDFWQPNKWSKICSKHFKAEDRYTTGKGYIILKKSAIPAFEIPHGQSSLHLPSTQSRSDSPNSLVDVDVSDLDSIFDSPREAALKKRIEKINSQKEKFIIENRNLRSQNKRLRKRVAHLVDLLKQLKK